MPYIHPNILYLTLYVHAETRPHCVTKTGLELCNLGYFFTFLEITLPYCPKYWDYNHATTLQVCGFLGSHTVHKLIRGKASWGIAQ